MASDDFNRADGGLGANWTTNDGSWSIVSNQAVPGAGPTAGNLARWTAQSFGAEQFAEVTVHGANRDGGPAVRVSTGITGYVVSATATTVKIFRIDADETYVELLDCGTTSADGDTIRLEVAGTRLVAKKNGAQIGTVTDSTYSSGAPGIWMYATGSKAVDNWVGDNLPHNLTMMGVG